MIFVIQVPPSKSEELIQRLKEVPFIKDAFSPLKKKKIKLRGYWEIREVRLFPDYIFVECDDPKDVYQKLKDFSFFTKLLGVRDKKDNELYFIPLSEDEEAFLNHLMGKDNREVIGISKVMLLKNKQITIIDGILCIIFTVLLDRHRDRLVRRPLKRVVSKGITPNLREGEVLG